MLQDRRQNPDAAFIADLKARYPTEPAVERTLERKLRHRCEGKYTSWNLEEARERLCAYLRARLDEPFELMDVKPLGGGGSKEQFCFRLVRRAGGSVVEQQMVLRLESAESVVQTNRLREFQILAAVFGTLPVPEVYWIDEDGTELGRPALIYEFVRGRASPPTPEQGINTVLGLWPARFRNMVSDELVQIMAQMAVMDLSGADLSAFDYPAAGTNTAVISGINWWQRVWEEDRVEADPLMSFAEDWLRRNAPAVDRVSIVHNDFRPGNFLFDPESGKITAILDWETARFGDRHEDLAYFMQPLLDKQSETGETLVGGLMPREVFLDKYERYTGLPVDEKRLAYYAVFQCWRCAVMAFASSQRSALGMKSQQDILLEYNARAGNVYQAGLLQALARA